MDKKEQQLFNYYYNKFAERSFDEKDVLSFLLFVRERAQDNKVMKELGDFVVSRENYSGDVKAFFNDCKKSLTISEKEKIKRSRICFPSKKSEMASTHYSSTKGWRNCLTKSLMISSYA